MSFFTFKRKIAIDVSLSILLLCCMAYHLTGNSGHEWLGTVFFNSIYNTSSSKYTLV